MGADLRLDHVVILVRDLDTAIAEWTDLGFTVVRGGAHEGSPTHNVLIALADGSYLELIARRPGTEGTPPGLAERLLRLEPDEGLADFALLSDDLNAIAQAAHRRGLDLLGPVAMGRTRPDGQQIAWELGFPPTLDLPFLIRDVTPRALRVPGGVATEHANGATGVEQILIEVPDLEQGIARYRALLGTDPVPWEPVDLGPTEFTIVATPLSLADPDEFEQLMHQWTTAPSEAERAALEAQLRTIIQEGVPGGPEVGHHEADAAESIGGADFTLGGTMISLTPAAGLNQHGTGPALLSLRARGLDRPRSLKSGLSYQHRIKLVPETPALGS